MTIIYLIAAFAAGALIAWFAGRSYMLAAWARQTTDLQAQHAAVVTDIEGRAKGAEAVSSELRAQVKEKEDKTVELRAELDQEKQYRARLEEAQVHLKQEIERFREMEKKLGETFKALSLDALAKNSDEFKKYADEFMKLAEEKLRSQTTEGKKELDTKKELIDQNIETIGKTLSEVQRKIEEVGKSSGDKLTHVAALIQKHEEVTSKLNTTTDHLKQALASSKKRGEWGERMAEDIIRLIGMVEGVNYIKQKTLEHAAGRPDYTFLLPNRLKINMDVKFPMDNYQYYLDAQSEHDRKRFRDELLKNTRLMIRQVTTRDYINPAENTVDYVIIFIPNEQVYGFINESDRTIMDEALRQKVILCSPFTLYAVLAVIRQAVENFNLERTASEILKLLSEFSKQWAMYKDKFKIMGERLEAAKKEYDSIVTTRTNMLERPLRKIEELRQRTAIGTDEELKLTDQQQI
ncbi:MAG: DNA recombination protein RmuC [Nitrospiraceae bacterium]|nr:DNA recombination protein RmuC [Nitrospiraceae bacterium]